MQHPVGRSNHYPFHLFCICLIACFNCTGQMLVFGWRIPFLLSAVNASAALALRMHMPEPHEVRSSTDGRQAHALQSLSNLC